MTDLIILICYKMIYTLLRVVKCAINNYYNNTFLLFVQTLWHFLFGTCFLYLQQRYPEWRSEGWWSRSFQESFSHFHPQFLQKYDRKIIAQLNKGLSKLKWQSFFKYRIYKIFEICDVTCKINKLHPLISFFIQFIYL